MKKLEKAETFKFLADEKANIVAILVKPFS
jgi:hypothetical protein